MINHFEGIKFQDGNASVRIPNSIYRYLSNNIEGKDGRANSLQTSFAFSYLIATSFLYRYAYFVDIDGGTYIQNSDLKELLGYGKTTKTVNKIIKRGGILDSIGLTQSTSEYPVAYFKVPTDTINNIPLVEFVTIGDSQVGNRDKIKSIVKNRNYDIKEPLFMTTKFDDNEYGTLYSYEHTHEITIDEFLLFIKDGELNNLAFMIYSYIKSISKGLMGNSRSIGLNEIANSLKVDMSVFYKYLEILKKRKLIDVEHKGWKMSGDGSMEANTYIWIGI